MSTKTGIEWTDSTWSPIRFRVKYDASAIALEKGYSSLVPIAEKMAGRVGSHCEHVSPGCEHCYAETNNHRCLPANGTGLPYDRRSRDLVDAFIDEKILLQPLKWRTLLDLDARCPNNHLAGAHGPGIDGCICPQRRRRIFVENQSDLFGEWVTDEMLDRVFAIMALSPQHDFQVLTKRPERMLAYSRRVEQDDSPILNLAQTVDAPGWKGWGSLDGRTVDVSRDEDGSIDCISLLWPLPNVWLGVSVEDQPRAEQRIRKLIQTPATHRFLSCEPLLGPLNLTKILCPAGTAGLSFDCIFDAFQYKYNDHEPVRWVIVGGESGPGARPFHTEWAKGIVNQCFDAGVPCFVKQLGANVWQEGERHVKRDKKGGDMSEWPHELRVRQFPEVNHGA